MRYFCRGLFALVLTFAIVFTPFLSVPAALADLKNNPFPTIAISDYVFGCMASNGRTRDSLERCSCSIDVIATIITYQDYVDAETVLSMRRLSGEKSVVFKTSSRWKQAVTKLRRAQAEAEVRCF